MDGIKSLQSWNNKKMMEIDFKLVSIGIILVILVLSGITYSLLGYGLILGAFGGITSSFTQFMQFFSVLAWFASGITCIVLMFKRPLVGGISNSALYIILNSFFEFRNSEILIVLALSVAFTVIQIIRRK